MSLVIKPRDLPDREKSYQAAKEKGPEIQHLRAFLLLGPVNREP